MDSAINQMIAFSDAPQRVTVVTGCRTLELGYSFDTDGDSITFGAVPEQSPACLGEFATEDAALLLALEATDHWSVADATKIAFHASDGSEVLALAREESGSP